MESPAPNPKIASKPMMPGDVARLTGGLHIYGGDFFDTKRSQWSAESLAEEPSDGAAIRAMFERENPAWSAAAISDRTALRRAEAGGQARYSHCGN
jgi:hypothetical protein